MTIGLGEGNFLLLVNDDHVSNLHGYGNTGLQRFWSHEFDLFGSRDVISHVITKLGICGLGPSFGVTPFKFMEKLYSS